MERKRKNMEEISTVPKKKQKGKNAIITQTQQQNPYSSKRQVKSDDAVVDPEKFAKFQKWLHSGKVNFEFYKDRICSQTLKAISDMGLSVLTTVQLMVIPSILDGKDVIAIAKTGSGKTLAFLIPIVQQLYNLKVKPKRGTVAIIMSPTRELAMQTFEVLKQLVKYHELFSIGLAIGGKKLTKEVEQLRSGVNILVATPGRLLDHLQNTNHFMYDKLKFLVIDEVDRMLDIGFEKDMKEILEILSFQDRNSRDQSTKDQNSNDQSSNRLIEQTSKSRCIRDRQTIMCTATKSDKVLEIKCLALKENPLFIEADDDNKTSTVTDLQQFFTICPTQKRLVFLFYFLHKAKKKKVMVFCSTANQVKFYCKLFQGLDCGINAMQLHGQKKQTSRTNTFFEFCSATTGTLFCTDVAARGLDIPEVDYIVQYDPPNKAREYIHRVGRTARGTGKKGQTLLVLQPGEEGFLKKLEGAKVGVLEEYTIPWDKLRGPEREETIEELLKISQDLKTCAAEALKSYIAAYKNRKKETFHVSKLKLEELVQCFGFTEVSPYFKSFFSSFVNY